MQGIEIEEKQDVQIDINVSSYIPDEYIKESSQKIEVYQNIALCKTEDDIQNVIDEIIDRFGNMPNELENLLEITRIKQLCEEKNIIKVAQKNTNVVFTFNNKKFNFSTVEKMLKTYNSRIKFSTGNPYITLKLNSLNNKEILSQIKEFILNV